MPTPVIIRLIRCAMRGVKYAGGVKALSVSLSGGETENDVECCVRFVTKDGYIETMVSEITCGAQDRRSVF